MEDIREGYGVEWLKGKGIGRKYRIYSGMGSAMDCEEEDGRCIRIPYRCGGIENII